MAPPAWNADLRSARAARPRSARWGADLRDGSLSRCNRTEGTLPDLCRPGRTAARRPRAFGPLCRPEVGVPSRTGHQETDGSELGWLPAGPGESVKGALPFHKKTTTNRNLAAARRRRAREFRLRREAPSDSPAGNRPTGWMRGLEPPTTGTTIRCSAVELHPPPKRKWRPVGAPGRIRTPDPRLRRPPLCPTELLALPRLGIGPAGIAHRGPVDQVCRGERI